MVQKEQNKTKISLLKNAEFLFANFGYEGTTIRTIAEKSGTNSAMINYYFGSKENLYHALFENHLDSIVNKINDIKNKTQDPAQRLTAFLEYYCGRIQTHQDYYRILFSQLFGMQTPEILRIVSTLRKNIFEFLTKTIAEGIEKKRFAPIDEEMLAINIMTLLPALNSSNKGFLNLSEEVNQDISKRVIAYFMSSLKITQ
ncbi:TetR/AcrR family transcriptional regulator [Pedobacter mucosus]|uniref:TetR/AcrR family transcriptional regulator n=1 Tax=Pedobacter mucosus TaxID=2895286 RepID=UPI001EE3B1ED|nr:TetR/AcrR family transcriptional regulator [Pedobacter mucosus]UKT65999.1 TetR/AcrR family transcriptional regulator [Pedobacter mucosus]